VGKHQDFDTGWYYDIGAKITMAMISNSIAPVIGPTVEPLVKKLLRHILDRCFKKHLLKLNNLENPPPKEGEEVKQDDQEPAEDLDKEAEDGAEEQNEGGDEGEEKKEEEIPGDDECETKILFQDDLNRFYTGEPVKIWYLYAWLFTNIMIYYLYSSGMPLMYLFGIIFFTVNYLAYKFLFFYWNQKAFGWDAELSLSTLSLLKWAVLAHLLMALFMFSNKRLMTPEGYTPADYYKVKGENAGRFFKRRFDNTQTIFVLTTMIIFIAIYLFWRTIVKGILFVLDIKKARKNIEEDDDAGGGDEEAQIFKAMIMEDSSDDIYREMTIECLKDHYVRANKEFE